MFDRTTHNHYYAPASLPDLTACRLGIEDCIARLTRMETLLMTTTAQVKEALTAVTTDVADETHALNAFDTTLANIATKLDSLVQQVAANGNVPQEIADQIAALQLAISQNRDHIVNLAAKGTELAGKATSDPGPNTEVPPQVPNPNIGAA